PPFIAAKGVNGGKSLCEHELADPAKATIPAATRAGAHFVLPETAGIPRWSRPAPDKEVVHTTPTPADAMVLDVGPKSIAAVNDWISKAETLVWNGPLGAFEIAPFDKATVAVAKHAAGRTRQGSLVSVAGGGDTVAALNHAEVADDFSYVSTAGGAFLEWMEGKPLPGVDILKQK
ncbi:phosphoglycerate kinase, partial [Ensifer sp. LC14]|uniref:phosphoglycerate kinase n=1 Tax=Ensifer sp. LC14 TaxID=1873714 RepID=UPI000813B050